MLILLKEIPNQSNLPLLKSTWLQVNFIVAETLILGVEAVKAEAMFNVKPIS